MYALKLNAQVELANQGQGPLSRSISVQSETFSATPRSSGVVVSKVAEKNNSSPVMSSSGSPSPQPAAEDTKPLPSTATMAEVKGIIARLNAGEDVDLNAVSVEVNALVKDEMGSAFEANRLRPGDPG